MPIGIYKRSNKKHNISKSDFKDLKSYTKAYSKLWEKDNLNKRKIYNDKIFKRNSDYIDSYKLMKGCFVCGYNKHPHALHFDHIDRSKKFKNISDLKPKASLKIINIEINKCNVLCANCHAEKTDKNKDYERFN